MCECNKICSDESCVLENKLKEIKNRLYKLENPNSIDFAKEDVYFISSNGDRKVKVD